MQTITRISIALLFLCLGLAMPLWAQQTIRIGVLAFQPQSLTAQKWSVLGEYLDTTIPDSSIMVVPMSQDELEKAIHERQIDYVLTNPFQYILFQHLYGLSPPLATVVRGSNDKPLHAFGGSIFTLTHNSGIETLGDLQGHHVAIPFRTAFGAFQMQQYELLLHGLPVIKPDKLIVTGLPHDSMVRAVLDGRADVGFARAGTLERMTVHGEIELEQFKVINQQPFADFPVKVSTHLYPEWPIAALPHVDSRSRAQMISALLTFEISGQDVLPFNVLGFNPPADYQDVEEMLRSLRAPPFDYAAKVRFADIWEQYSRQIVASALALFTILLLSVYLFYSSRRIRKAEASFRSYFERDAMVKLVIDPVSGSLLDVNEQAVRYYGYTKEELLRSSIFDINTLSEPEWRQMMRRVVDGEVRFVRFQHRIASGEVRQVDVSTAPIWQQGKQVVISTINDVTDRIHAEQERDRMEEQLRQKHKMEALGVMAGGIAHNFNNTLAAILGGIELADLKRNNPDNVSTYLANAKKGVLRARDLVKQILAYSRSGASMTKEISLVQSVTEALELLKSTIPSTIRVIREIENENATILADPSRIQEVIFNLCNNAVQAMDEKGTLTITLDQVYLEENDIPAGYACAPGDYVRLGVKDSGCGMDEDQLGSIFDPFYTTKPVGKGTGMGLATVQGIVSQHKGLIKVQSTPGEGSLFELCFPLLKQAGEYNHAELLDKEILAGHESILLVDDEAMITQLCHQQLTELGYRICAFQDSKKALNAFASNPEGFDLVITDQTMPELTGKELITELKKIRPELPAIMITGYSSKIDEHQATAIGINAYCLKPMQIGELSQTIRAVLDKK